MHTEAASELLVGASQHQVSQFEGTGPAGPWPPLSCLPGRPRPRPVLGSLRPQNLLRAKDWCSGGERAAGSAPLPRQAALALAQPAWWKVEDRELVVNMNRARVGDLTAVGALERDRQAASPESSVASLVPRWASWVGGVCPLPLTLLRPSDPPACTSCPGPCAARGCLWPGLAWRLGWAAPS